MKNSWLILLIVLCSYQLNYAQEELFFHNYPLPTNGSGAGLAKITQDHQGFYWFKIPGQGVYIYDGTSFEKLEINIHNSKDSDWIRNLIFDSSGRAWVLGLDFIGFFDTYTNQFKEVFLKGNQKIESLDFISGDSDNRFWLVSKNQLMWFDYYDNDSLEIKLIPTPTIPTNSQYNILDLKEGPNGDMWILTEYGLIKLNHDGIPRDYFAFNSEINHGFLYWDWDNRLWVGTNVYGPVLFDQENIEFHYPWNDVLISGKIDSTNFYSVGSILQENDSIYWIGTDGSGLVRYNYQRNSGRIFRENAAIKGAMIGNKVNTLYRDWFGNIMMINDGSHFTVLKNNLKHVKWYFHDPTNNQSLGSPEVSSTFLANDNDYLWIGVEGSGIDRLNIERNSFDHYTPSTTNSNSIFNARTMKILVDNQGWVWAGQWEGGLTRFDPGTNNFIRYSTSFFPSDTTISDITVNTLFEDSNGNIWVITSEAIDVFDNTYAHKKRLQLQDIWSISEENGRILLGGRGRFGYVEGDSLVKIANTTSTSRILKYEDIYYLSDFVNGTIRWSKDGYVKKDSATFGQLLGGVNDSNGNLWFTRDKLGGLVRYSHDSSSFHMVFGLDEDVHIKPSFVRNKEIWGASKFGLFHFDPSKLTKPNLNPTPVFTGIKLNNKESLFCQDDIDHAITLNHKAKTFEIQFAAPFLGTENKPVLEYKLDGFDETWIPADQSNSVIYMNLDPDDYTFMVRAIPPLGVGIPPVTSLPVKVIPAPWVSWWAFLGYILLGLALVYVVINYILKQERLKNSVELHKLELQQARELDRLKTQFFTNISHEFRTPLTLILGPLRQMKQGKFKGDEEAILNIMIRNSERLLKLINELLDLNKLQSGAESLKISLSDFSEFSKYIFAAFQSSADHRNINYTFECDESTIPMYFDSQKMDKVLTNLLSNAFKFTPDNGCIQLNISKKPSESIIDQGAGVLEVRVIDSGPGIPADKIDKVFDQFYQVDQEVTRGFEGSGVGLALVKEYVEMHQGSVWAESETGMGTTIFIQMPLGRDYLKGVEIQPLSTYQRPHIITERHDSNSNEDVLPSEKDQPILLIVEDNNDMRAYLKEVLKEDFFIVESEDGMAGFETAKEKVPDIIISDVMMPRMDGYQLCRRLKQDERTSHIPVVLLTARAGDKAKLEGLEFGADDYITKPFSPIELKIRVQNLMELIKSLRDQFRRESMLGEMNAEVHSKEERFLNRFMETLIIHRSNAGFGAEQFAHEMGMSRSQLHRKFKALTGFAVGEFVKTYRLKYARELLEQNYDNVTQVAYEAGFNSPSYFAESFKREFGYSPSAVKKKS